MEKEQSTVKANVVPLDSALRVNAIHTHIPEVKIPVNALGSETTLGPSETISRDVNDGQHATTMINPVTCKPFTLDELRLYNIESLLRQYPSPEAAGKAREDTAKELRKLLDENDRKRKEIERELEEKEKTREIERKVYAKKLGKDG